MEDRLDVLTSDEIELTAFSDMQPGTRDLLRSEGGVAWIAQRFASAWRLNLLRPSFAERSFEQQAPQDAAASTERFTMRL